jgi:hypothetical protein
MSLRSTREAEFVLLVGSFRFLNRSQIERFIFDGTVVGPRSRQVMTWRTLGRLKKLGLIAATPRQIGGSTAGSAGPGYFLTTAGAKLAASLNPGLPVRRPAARGTFLMSHGIMTGEVALAFRRSERSHPGHQLIEWESDWKAAQRLGASHVVPDARLVYATTTLKIDAFVEVDLGTEGTRFFAMKVNRYIELYRSGSWQAHLRIWPVVVTVTQSKARATALRCATEAVLSSQPDAEHITKGTEFDFCSLEDLLGLSGPLGAIWQVAGRPGLHALLASDDQDVAPSDE